MRVLSLTAFLVALGCGGGGGRPAGPPVPMFDTIRTVSGTISYFTRGPNVNNKDGNGRLLPQMGITDATIPRRAPRFPVQIFGPTGVLLGEAITDAVGNYSVTVNFGPNPATQVRVRVEARIDLANITVRVLRNRGTTEPYSQDSGLAGDPNSTVMDIDIVVRLDEGSAAYHILEMLFNGWNKAASGILAPFPDVDIYWEPGNGAVSGFVPLGPLAEFTIAGGITGDSTSNTDEWDPFALTRLQGQLILAYFSHDVAPAGDANGALVVPSRAWREGFLDFWACIARDSDEFWETEGSGVDGKVTRFFNIESFFDPALGSLGPDDPNVYQDPTVVGIGSRFTVAEVLWDIHDTEAPSDPGDRDGIEFPLFLTMRFFETISPGASYPYLYTLLDKYVDDNSLDAVTIKLLLTMFPEDQGIDYPATVADETVWPTPLDDMPILVPFDETVSDVIDQINPVPLSVDVGIQSQRYFFIESISPFDAILTVTTAGTLRVDLLNLNNLVLATGTNVAVANNVLEGKYIIRVSSIGGAQLAPFDLRVQLLP